MPKPSRPSQPSNADGGKPAQRQVKPAIDPTSLQYRDPERYQRLTNELNSPFRSLRQFVYIAVGASGGIGAFVFFFRVLAGRELETALPNLAFQVGLVALMVVLFRWEQKRSQR